MPTNLYGPNDNFHPEKTVTSFRRWCGVFHEARAVGGDEEGDLGQRHADA